MIIFFFLHVKDLFHDKACRDFNTSLCMFYLNIDMEFGQQAWC